MGETYSICQFIPQILFELRQSKAKISIHNSCVDMLELSPVCLPECSLAGTWTWKQSRKWTQDVSVPSSISTTQHQPPTPALISQMERKTQINKDTKIILNFSFAWFSPESLLVGTRPLLFLCQLLQMKNSSFVLFFLLQIYVGEH